MLIEDLQYIFNYYNKNVKTSNSVNPYVIYCFFNNKGYLVSAYVRELEGELVRYFKNILLY